MDISELKKLLKSENILIGTDRVLKNLRKGLIERIVISSNCSDEVVDEIKHLASLNKSVVESLNIPNEELGTLCKKPFSVSVLGFLK
ncbi:MAG: ribosomal L7Ae/L30e/S12e/Gadd45 family protein [Nanoarchaeota archaeon]|nr:ribosomal L7Ae/L30e/S12e/Gadd45 family protein [Nanoarchaeota archaeon]MBU1029739.1 ribosomal L7Ae/L30e/S12e/Gadd45 family protein [Nanoarchaeota archaeon]MBU1849162.1 ribosomal L7Ae/L30e/S12e/Gadd45 family protein [Nanoarchaeota archaeon]